MKVGKYAGLFFSLFCLTLLAFPARSQVRTLRMAFHVFQDNSGQGNFCRDSSRDAAFLNGLALWINHKLANLDTLTPAVSSPYVRDAGVRIRLDTVFYHRDSHAWDCSDEIEADYMRTVYIDRDTHLNYLQKHQTLPVFIGGNHPVVGGHSRNTGDKGYIAVRGFYAQYLNSPFDDAVEECARNLLHETGHCLGLSHNFRGGPGGDQCDLCDDNGCPVEGSSNNLMDYWPNYGHGLSGCQVGIIHSYLNGERGNISEVLVNDSCFRIQGFTHRIHTGEAMIVSDTLYLHGDLVIESGGRLLVHGYLSVPADGVIHLDPGASIDIDGGTIGNLCGDLWEGIRSGGIGEEGRSLIDIGNAGRIENARLAIRYGSATALSLDGAVFRNNIRCLVLDSGTSGSQEIDNSTFEITRLINHHEEGLLPVDFIYARDWVKLRLTGCILRNEPGTFLFNPDTSGTGIDFAGDTLVVTGSRFENLTTGILVRSGNEVAVDGNRFIHNRCAIRSRTGSYQAYQDNLLRLQRFNDVPTFGLLLEDAGLFRATANVFESEYGGGNMAGIFLIRPSDNNSYVAGNSWSNIPVANLVLSPPAIEDNLFVWADSGGGETAEPRLGPQFRFNEYDRTGIRLLLMPDSAYGTGIVGSLITADRSSESALEWPLGGFAWYNEKLPLIAGGQPDPSSRPYREHGFYLFMNSELIDTDDVPAWEPLKSYLNDIRLAEKDTANWMERDIVYKLGWFERLPACARSAILSSCLKPVRAEEKRWLRTALAGIAGQFTRADSSLVALGTWLASADVLPHRNPPTGNPGDPGPLPAFPAWSFFRFLPPVIVNDPTPLFDLVPNPAGDYICVIPAAGQGLEGTCGYEVTSAAGRVVMTGKISGWHDLKITTAQLPDGLYLLRLFRENTDQGTRRFVKIGQ